MALRILWLTNILLPEFAKFLGKEETHRGGWMPALAEVLSERDSIKLGIATNVSDVKWQTHKINNVTYYAVPMTQRNFNYNKLSKSLIEGFQRVVDSFKPDLIHIHGTEYFHGLLTGRGFLQQPTVISIQGILDVCCRYYNSGISLKELLWCRTLRDWIRFDGLFEQQRRMCYRAKYEREIFANNKNFIGRTIWDRGHTRRLNPNARYYHCDEMLRSPFYETSWDPENINQHTIFASSGVYPLKGFHVLIKAVELLKMDFPSISVRSPLLDIYSEAKGVNYFWRNIRTSGYSKYLTNLIRRKKLQSFFIPLGELDAVSMAKEFARAHVFVLSSYIENSSNSLGEAMLVGTPSVVAFTGGLSSMIVDGHSALGFPSGDEAVLAEQIRRIFTNNCLAMELSVKSRKTAQNRHSKKRIIKRLVSIYDEILDEAK
jgi:glycosyltransferase involved in cell wall biosynthesis